MKLKHLNFPRKGLCSPFFLFTINGSPKPVDSNTITWEVLDRLNPAVETHHIVARVVPWILEADFFFPRKGRLGGPLPVVSGVITPAGWWFQIFCVFTPIWGRFPF